jgi:hypothetical protein
VCESRLSKAHRTEFSRVSSITRIAYIKPAGDHSTVAWLGQPFAPCLYLDQRSFRDSGQELGCHSGPTRDSCERGSARRDRHRHVEFCQDSRLKRVASYSWDAGTKANRQAGRCGRRSRVRGFGQGTLDHRRQYPSRWRLQALTRQWRKRK